jgi:hypothetical protein
LVAVLSRLRQFPVLLLLLLILAGCGTSPAPAAHASRSPASAHGASSAKPPTRATPSDPTASATPTRKETLQLPRGGTTVFPRYRLVGYAGLTGASTLGRLGTGPLDERMAEIGRRYSGYGASRKILPVAEVITTIVSGSPGRDGKWRTRISDDRIAVYLQAARKQKALLLLNIQPGRSDFLTEVKAYEPWLEQPDVGVALDPEWEMGPGQVPGRVFGHTTGAELNEVSAYLSQIVADHHLPEKVMVYHQLAPRIVRQESALKPHKGVVVVKSVDGIGSMAAKMSTYRSVNRTTPTFVHPGFKLFYTEDTAHGRLMTPAQVLALKPRPQYVLYE